MTSTSPQTETQLVHNLQAKHPAAFTYLYDAYAPALYGVLLRLVKDQAIAEDLLQDAFVKIWTTIESYDANQGRLFTWMLAITRNLALDELRSQNRLYPINQPQQKSTSTHTYPTKSGLADEPISSSANPDLVKLFS